MSLHRVFIILGIFVWCAYVNGQGTRQVNCEVYVYHPNCRGMQARKRFVHSIDNVKADSACPCRNSKKQDNANNNNMNSLTNPKILEALFSKGFDANALYDAYAETFDRRRNYNVNRDRSNHRSRSTKDNSLDLGNPDMDEDY